MKYELGKDFLTFRCSSSGFTLNERTSEDWDKLLMSSFAGTYRSGKKSDRDTLACIITHVDFLHTSY